MSADRQKPKQGGIGVSKHQIILLLSKNCCMQDSIYMYQYLPMGRCIYTTFESLKHLSILRNNKTHLSKSHYEKRKGSRHLLEILVQ